MPGTDVPMSHSLRMKAENTRMRSKAEHLIRFLRKICILVFETRMKYCDKSRTSWQKILEDNDRRNHKGRWKTQTREVRDWFRIWFDEHAGVPSVEITLNHSDENEKLQFKTILVALTKLYLANYGGHQELYVSWEKNIHVGFPTLIIFYSRTDQEGTTIIRMKQDECNKIIQSNSDVINKDLNILDDDSNMIDEDDERIDLFWNIWGVMTCIFWKSMAQRFPLW